MSPPEENEPADLTADTAVQKVPAVPGWYSASLTDRWSYIAPAGGVLMTVALRAMTAELNDPALRLVSATAIFCTRIPEGPMSVRTEILRHGGAAAQVRGALAPAGSQGPGLEVSATFARDREGPNVIDAGMPDVPGPDEAESYFESGNQMLRRRLPIQHNFDVRLARGQKYWLPGWEAGPGEFAQWFRYLRHPKRDDGKLDPLAIPPIADTMPTALRMKLGPKYPAFTAPSLDLTVHFLDDTTSEWLLVVTRCRRALAGYATAEAEVWGADKKLVAFATQTMMIRKYPLST
jgi:acyl-CoA thioesterase